MFGSYARGEETPESDIDVYVIASSGADDGPSARRLGAAVRRALSWINPFCAEGLPKGKDVVCASPERFERAKGDFWSVEAAVEREGVLVYG